MYKVMLQFVISIALLIANEGDADTVFLVDTSLKYPIGHKMMRPSAYISLWIDGNCIQSKKAKL